MASEGIHPARRFGQHLAGPGIWPGEITSGTYHGPLPSGDPGAPGRLRRLNPRLPPPRLHSQSETSNLFLETVWWFLEGGELVPLEYSIARLTCAIASRPVAVMVGWPGAAQDRLPADVPPPRRGRAGVPRQPGEGR